MSSLQDTFPILQRLLKNTWTSIVRNKLLSIATLIVMMLVSFFVNILGSIDFLASYSIESINKKVDLTLEIKEGVDIDAPDVTDLKQELELSGSFVIKITKEQALKDFKQILPDLGNFLEKYRQNPLPASLYVTTTNLKDYENITKIVEKPQYKKLINFDQNENSFTNQRSRITKIVDISESAKRFVLLLQILFFIVSVIIIFNTVRIIIHNRRDEIAVMKLVGASKSYIATPFILEGVFYGMIGAIIGLLFYFLALNVVYYNIHQVISGGYIKTFFGSLWEYYQSEAIWVTFRQLFLFGIIGAVSSVIALNRFVVFYTFNKKQVKK